MKYYIYISEAKVDMLFPQVPHDIKKKVALEFKMDLKLLSASRKTETETEDNRIARLETVVDFIRQYGNVGSVDAPEEYIDDSLSMRWGPLGYQRELVYFATETEHTVVGLGGSMKHVLGGVSEGNGSHLNSLTPALMDCLYKELGWGENLFKLMGGTRRRDDETFLQAVDACTKDMYGSPQKLDFLAKRLLEGDIQRRDFDSVTVTTSTRHVLLGSPLYVAMAS